MINNEDEGIRSPDETKRERLIEPVKTQEEIDFETAINESIQNTEDFNNTQMNILMDKIQERKIQCQNILFVFKRLIKMDKSVADIFIIIEPILDLYMCCDIDNYVLDNATHKCIFALCKKIRFNPKDFDLLESIFLNENENI